MKLVKAIAVFGLMTASAVASAQEFYGGAGIGITQIEDEEGSVSYDDSPFGWRLLAGYDFNENFAIEGSYINSGEAEDEVFGESVEVELSGFTVSVVGLYPVSDTMKLFGKAGFYDGETEVTVDGFTADEDESGATLGAGVRFKVQDQLSIRGEFDWFDTDIETVWSLSVGFQYAFGN